MNDARTVTINGKLYYIENDAYQRLHLYLSQLKTVFGTTEEGAEIVNDIEGRVAELFDEIPAGTSDRVINIQDINNIITVVGQPEEIARECELQDGMTPPPYTENKKGSTTPPPLISINLPGHRKLYRNLNNTVFGGVLSGLATYFNWNVTILRLLVIVLTLCTSFFPVFIIYCILWMVIPPADTPARVLAMQGSDVNPATLGHAVMTENTAPASDGGTVGTFLRVVAKLALGFIGVIAGMVGLGTLVAALVITSVMIGSLISGNPVWLSAQELAITGIPQLAWWGLGVGLSVCLLITLICAALVWTACCVLLKVRAASRSTRNIIFGIGGILLACFIWTLSMTAHYENITDGNNHSVWESHWSIESDIDEDDATHATIRIYKENPDSKTDTITIGKRD